MNKDFTKDKKNWSKKAIINGKKTTANCFRYDSTLKDYLDEALRLLKEEEDVQPGSKLGNKHYTRKARNQGVKVDVLNKIIFPSMANLIYLFEFINHHPQLGRLLDKDIDELLGLKGVHFKTRNADERKKYSAFQRIMYSLISYQNKNTRLAILNIIGHEIIKQLIILGTEKEPLIGNKILLQDLGRAQVWMRHVTSDIKLNVNRAHRPITF